MKHTQKLMLSLAGVVCTASAVQASNFTFAGSSGNLDLVFSQTGKNDLEINLGSVNFFTGLTPGVEFKINTTSRPNNSYDIATELNSNFGGNSDGVTFRVIGTQTDPNDGSTFDNYLTRARSNPEIKSATPATFTSSKNASVGGNINGITSAAVAETAPVINTADVVSMDPASANAFTKKYNATGGLKSQMVTSIDNTTPSGANWSAKPDLGIVRSDLYSFIPGSTPNSYLGFFTFYNDGEVSFTPVPEAGTAGAIIGGLLLVGAMMHRNRSDSFSLGKQA